MEAPPYPESLLKPTDPPPEIRPFLITLFARRHEGVFTRQAKATIGTWSPQPHYCFPNCKEWVRFNPTHKCIVGFLYFDYLPLGFVRFTPHAVIEVDDGTLVDITPHGVETPYPFLRHVGTGEEFQAMVDAQGERTGVDLIFV